MLIAQPLRVGHLTLKHRMVLGPMGNRMWTQLGEPQPNLLPYYARRVAGGAAMVTISPAQVHGGYDNGPRPSLWRDEAVELMRRLTDAIHAGGAHVIAQLVHEGASAKPPVSPSGIPCLSSQGFVEPRALSLAEVEEFRELFVAAALRAQRAGFDGVELGGQAGYLLGSFLSPRLNRREDHYGGSAEARMQFGLGILRAIRAACGTQFALGYALSVDELTPGGMTPADCLPFAQALQADGLDYLDIRVGTHETFTLSERATAHNRFQSRAGIWDHSAQFKRALSIPVFCSVQGCYDPQLWEAALQAGQADVIQLGKTLLADPDVPTKVLAGRTDEIRPCVLCMACLEPSVFYNSMNSYLRCAINPEVGAEAGMQLTPAARPRRVAVIGGGPAGMEAARIAAQRGHAVTLFERNPALGGNLQSIARSMSGESYGQLRDWFAGECARAGVDVRLGTQVSAASLRAGAFDVAILATGAPLHALPAIKGLDQRPVLQATEVLAGAAVSGAVAIIGGGQAGVEVALTIAARGGATGITLIEPDETRELGHGFGKLERIYSMTVLMPKYRVAGHVGMRVEEVRSRELLARDRDGGRQKIRADTLVLALPGAPDTAFEQSLRAIDGLEVHVIGEATGTRLIGEVIHDGARVGRAI